MFASYADIDFVGGFFCCKHVNMWFGVRDELCGQRLHSVVYNFASAYVEMGLMGKLKNNRGWNGGAKR